jgi:hypothetical protein
MHCQMHKHGTPVVPPFFVVTIPADGAVRERKAVWNYSLANRGQPNISAQKVPVAPVHTAQTAIKFIVLQHSQASA